MLGESLRRRRRVDSHKAERPPVRWSRWLLAAIIAVPVCFGTGYGLAVGVLFPVPAQVAGETVVVPELAGRRLADAEQHLRTVGLDVGRVSRQPHPTEEDGVVIAQSPVPGQWLRPGASVRLAVSTGPARILVPDVVGLSADDAAVLAERLGFAVERIEQPDAGAAGLVVSVDPSPGTERALPATIRLTVSVPLPVIPVDTVPLGSDPFPDPPVFEWVPAPDTLNR